MSITLGEAVKLKTLLGLAPQKKKDFQKKEIRYLMKRYKKSDPAGKKIAEETLGIPQGKTYRTAYKHMVREGAFKALHYKPKRKVSALHQEVMRRAQVDIQQGVLPGTALESAWASVKEGQQ